MIFSFTLTYPKPDLASDNDFTALCDKAYEAGCDDCLIGTGIGLLVIDFEREAPTLWEAIKSAVESLSTVEGIGTLMAIKSYPRRNRESVVLESEP